MAFRDQAFAHRFQVMGDIAEAKFEEVWQGSWERFGLSRPRLHVASLPQRIRHTPDYITSKNFVEVKGVGREQILKIKVVEYNCMQFWNQVHPLIIFVWDSYGERHTSFPLDKLAGWIDSGKAELSYYPEGKAFFAIPCSVVFGD